MQLRTGYRTVEVEVAVCYWHVTGKNDIIPSSPSKRHQFIDHQTSTPSSLSESDACLTRRSISRMK